MTVIIPSGLKHTLSTQNLRRKLLKRGRLLSYINGILSVFEGTLRREIALFRHRIEVCKIHRIYIE